MGFSTTLLLLYPVSPDSEPDGNLPLPNLEASAKKSPRTMWRAEDTISFGDVTRMEKMTDKKTFGHLRFSSRQRAGMCAVDFILKRLFAKSAKPTREDFAPKFLIYQEYPKRYELLASAEFRGTKEYVDLNEYCMEYFPKYALRLFRPESLVRHNEVIAMSESQLVTYLTSPDYHPIMRPPYMWEKCGTLAEWLHAAEAEKSGTWQELEKEPTSLALVRAWRAYLEEVGKVGVRALFVFGY